MMKYNKTKMMLFDKTFFISNFQVLKILRNRKWEMFDKFLII